MNLRTARRIAARALHPSSNPERWHAPEVAEAVNRLRTRPGFWHREADLSLGNRADNAMLTHWYNCT